MPQPTPPQPSIAAESHKVYPPRHKAHNRAGEEAEIPQTSAQAHLSTKDRPSTRQDEDEDGVTGHSASICRSPAKAVEDNRRCPLLSLLSGDFSLLPIASTSAALQSPHAQVGREGTVNAPTAILVLRADTNTNEHGHRRSPRIAAESSKTSPPPHPSCQQRTTTIINDEDEANITATLHAPLLLPATSLQSRMRTGRGRESDIHLDRQTKTMEKAVRKTQLQPGLSTRPRDRHVPRPKDGSRRGRGGGEAYISSALPHPPPPSTTTETQTAPAYYRSPASSASLLHRTPIQTRHPKVQAASSTRTKETLTRAAASKSLPEAPKTSPQPHHISPRRATRAHHEDEASDDAPLHA
ncbi:hypothetical protein R3P38DRAFT_3347617 [Favolaschia claudopus]|uniref:Uncharacterized protein n=1 Tax=Favolaschia claudopus TaxID=2862362 RepID=A0AAW0CU57_9AGAR